MDRIKNKRNLDKKSNSTNCFCKKHPIMIQEKAQFIKYRDERGNILQRSQRKCFSDYSVDGSCNNSIQSPSKIVVFNKTDLTSLSSEIKMTARRKCYELTKQFNTLGEEDDGKEITPPPFNISDGTLIENFSEEMLNSLNQFRLKNAQDCFAFLDIRKLHEKLIDYKNFVRPHICEYSFYLNDTGLLEPADKNLDGKAVCSICHKVLNDVDSNIPMANNNTNLNTDVTKEKFKKPDKVMPERSSKSRRKIAWWY